ncbi:MAG: RNA-binding domain-containing protein [Candidatus Hadarchaeales archaeon]
MRFPLREIRVKILVHATEDESKLAEVLRVLLPAGTKVERTELEGQHGNPISLLEARVRGRREVEGTISSLLRKLENREALLSSLGSYMDEQGNLYLRLDKQLACRGRWVLGRGDEVIHLTLRGGGGPSKAGGLLEFLKSLGKEG